jgi:beta-lactamase regulating signal transducer with metallopeptidase domain
MQEIFTHLPVLLKMSSEASILIVLVLAAQWLCGRRLKPRWRCALWLLVLLRLALPWTISSPVSLFNVFKMSAAPQVQGEPARVEAMGTPIGKTQGVATVAPSPGINWLAWLWAIGALSLASCVLVSQYKFRRRVKWLRPLTDGPTLSLLEDCKALMGVNTPVSLVETEAINSPTLFGFVRPRLLLPTGLVSTFTRGELRHVFLHELAHIKRHDILTGWVALGLQIVHWFNPLVWLAFHRLRADRELACDALALSYVRTGENESYGLTIVKLLEGFGQPVWGPSLAGILENKQQTKERITMIAKFHKTDRGLALAILLLAGLALVTLTDAQNRTQPQPADIGEPDASKGVWAVRFEPVGDFSPKTPGEFLSRIPVYSGQHGEIGYFRTKKQGDKLVGSFLAYDGDQLKTALDALPGIKVTSVEKLTQEQLVEYEKLPQESLIDFNENLDVSKGVWAVRFEPTGDFAPRTPGEFLGRIHIYSGQDGEIGYFRTTKQGDKLIGSFLAYDGDQLKAALDKVPGIKVISVEKLTQETLASYEKSPQESLIDFNQLDASQGVWAVRFEPVGDFSPKTPGEFLARIPVYSGQHGEIGYFRTKVQGDKLVGSFLAYDGDQLKAALDALPGIKVTSVEKLTQEQIVEYEKLPQEALEQMLAPHVVATTPAVGATDVDPALTEITVTFNQDMGGGMSWTGGGPDFPPGQEGQKAYWHDQRTCVLPVKLEAGHYYRVGINSKSYRNFASDQGMAALPSAIYFTTQGASQDLKARTLVPQVVLFKPPNGARDVSTTVTELRVTFNVPMGGGCSWCTVGDSDSDFPKGVAGKNIYWTEDKKTCVLPVDLKPGMTYRLSLNAPDYKNFQSDAGVPLEPVIYTFRTSVTP